VSGAILGIDVGRRRIGVAIADLDGLAARPLETITLARPRSSDDSGGDPVRAIAAVVELARRHDARELVVGLPLDMSGAEGEMALGARTFADGLRAALGVPVSLRDERLSSSIAESRVGAMPRGRSGGAPSRTQRDRYRARVDREAAAIILQDELDARRARAAGR